MNQPKVGRINRLLQRFASWSTARAGSSWAFLLALGLTVIWLMAGPFWHYCDSWQLVMNTVSSIVTFLMVFLLQRSQNKDSLAMQVKLNEMIAAVEGASNRLINVEELTEGEVRALHRQYRTLAERAEDDPDATASHSIEEVEGRSEDVIDCPAPIGTKKLRWSMLIAGAMIATQVWPFRVARSHWWSRSSPAAGPRSQRTGISPIGADLCPLLAHGSPGPQDGSQPLIPR